MKIHVSAGNSKLGAAIPNVSLVPVASCPSGVPCSKDCYAMKSYRMYPSVKSAWTENLELAKSDPIEFWRQASAWLDSNRKKPAFFRIHVAGDFFSQEYFDACLEFCARHPEIKFLAFTKFHSRAVAAKKAGIVPSNLTLILSCWTGLAMPEDTAGLNIAYMQDGLETRVPADAIHCPGNCETCGMCWQLPAIGKDVVFNKH
jgi:hypothetical protein